LVREKREKRPRCHQSLPLAIRIDPEDAIAWQGLGVAYANLKRYDDAIEAYREAIRINPEDAIAWQGLGTLTPTSSVYDDAIEAYRQAIRININPEDGSAWFWLGVAYANLKRYDDAIRSLPPGHPYRPGGCHRLARPRGRLRQPQAPRRRHQGLRETVRINPELAVAWYNLVIAYVTSGNRAAALNAIEKLRRLDPAMQKTITDPLRTTGASPWVKAVRSRESEGTETLSKTKLSSAASATGVSPWVSTGSVASGAASGQDATGSPTIGRGGRKGEHEAEDHVRN